MFRKLMSRMFLDENIEIFEIVSVDSCDSVSVFVFARSYQYKMMDSPLTFEHYT